MLQEFTLARGAARCPPCYVHALALLALIAGVWLRCPPAFGRQCRRRSASIAPPPANIFFDGNFDHVAELKVVFGAPGWMWACWAISPAPARVIRSSIAAARGTSTRQGRDGRPVVLLRRRANDIPLIADMDGDGREDLCSIRDGIWYVSAIA